MNSSSRLVSIPVARLNNRKFGREPRLNTFGRVVPVLNQDFGYVLAGDDNNRVTVFSDFLVTLTGVPGNYGIAAID
jgi:hypothetical protein